MAKTLQITGDSPYGGGGYLILRWCKYLLSKGWQVDVLGTDPYWISELKKIPGLKIIDEIFIPRGISPMSDLKAFRQLIQLLNREHYDVVHTYTATPGFLGRIASRLVGESIILHHQAGWTVTEFSSGWERLFYTPLEYIATLASTKDICVSHAVWEQAREFHIAPMDKLVVVCNGIDPEPFNNTSIKDLKTTFRQKFNIPETHVLIGNTGRLAAQKDNGTLIRAMSYLKTYKPDLSFTLLLAGDGEDRPKMEQLIEELHLEHEVRLVGFITDIPAFLSELDIFVSPSLWEGLSISVLEAMAAAKPIVTTTILPNAELILHEKTGLLVEPKEPEQIARSIIRFIENPQLANECGLAAKQRVWDAYTIDRMFSETYDLYLGDFHRSQ